jgi:hypothetical protein
VAGAVNATATTIVCDAPTEPFKNVKAGDQLIVEGTQEIIHLNEDPVSPYTTITNVTRHFGSTAPGVGILDNAILRKLVSSYGSGTRAPQAQFLVPTVIYNYLQICKETTKFDNSSLEMDLRPWDDIKKEGMKQALERLMLGLEMSLFFGVRNLGTDAAGNRRSTFGGLNTTLTSNVTDFSSTGVTKNGMEDYLEQLFLHGSDTKVAFCGGTAFKIFNRMADRNTQTNYSLSKVNKNETYGLKIDKWAAPQGDLLLIRHPYLSLSAEYTKWVFCLDTEYVKYVYLNNRDIDWDDNDGKGIQNRDEDAWKGQYLGEVGMQLVLEETHGIMKGISEYVP